MVSRFTRLTEVQGRPDSGKAGVELSRDSGAESREQGMEIKRQNTFLAAEWKALVMLNYAVDSSLVERFVPPGTELDSFKGRTYVILVGFEFNRSRIFGFPVPFHQTFEEVNLRFYVRRSSKRGVVFIRELVPKCAVAVVARFAFHENYSCVPMSHRIETGADGDVVKAEYAWRWGSWRSGSWRSGLWRSGSDRCMIRIETEGASFLPPEGSASQFITEHYWGYAAQPGGGCLEY